ncbi:MAG: hypothetical protein GWP68_07710 [Verrucomicrobiaceae bacterium]|jgi:hypothetical protein|nr:hypothetical protein [Verrucomicrobiaceae bacterium]
MKTQMTLLILSLCMLSCAQNDSNDRGDSKSGASMIDARPMAPRQVAHQPRINHTWQWALVGLSMDELVRRFGPSERLNSGQYLFKKFDPEVHVNWHITVDMWQDTHNRQPVVHQVRFERRVRFSTDDLRLLREINSKGLKWEGSGAGKGWFMYKTVVPNGPGVQYDPIAQPELRAGVKHVNAQSEAAETVIYTLRFNQRN